LPLDGSKLAESALPYLQALRPLGDLQVLLLSVVDESDERLEHAEARGRESRLLTAYLNQVQRELAQRFELEAKVEVQNGIPAEVILRFEQDLAPALTVIATHGRTGLARWRLGSVADKVIRGAGSNTLLIGPRAAEGPAWPDAVTPPALDNILVPLDGSRLSEQALAVADRFVAALGTKLHLLRVLTPAIHTERPLGPENAPPSYFLTVPQAAEYLQGAAQSLSHPAEVKTEVRLGWPPDEIAGYAANNGIDLIVLTTHGRGGFARLAIGSVTDRLLGGPVPLLVVRSKPTGA
jgi:nucleotide-binding universal stress UspA family protein